MTTILLVDDEANLVELLQDYLEREGFDVLGSADGVSALAQVRTRRPDLVVLDVMLPALDGVEVCRRLRQFSEAYVLMLSARAEEADKLVGLAIGADDYVTKPFSARELVARVKVVLRRGGRAEGRETIRYGDVVVDAEQRLVTRRGEPVALTALQFDLLSA